MEPSLAIPIAGVGDEEGDACPKQVWGCCADERYRSAPQVESKDNRGIEIIEPVVAFL